MKLVALALMLSLLLLAVAPAARHPADAQPLPIACPNYVPFSTTASLQLVAASTNSNRWIGVCAWVVVAGAAEIFSLVEGKATACASQTEAVIGSEITANGLSLAANANLSLIYGAPFVRTTFDDNNLCIAKNGSNRIAGYLAWVRM